MVRYHDEEWGTPSRDDVHLFEMLTLEGAQAGLSWQTILNRREGYRQAFAGFDPARVARFRPSAVQRLMLDSRIVRNRLKIEATLHNAKLVLEMQRGEGSFSDYLWSFVEDTPMVGGWRSLDEIPAETRESREMSRALKRRGFRFVGPIICYSLMQAVGLAQDHVTTCFRSAELKRTDHGA